ncbi:MAG: ATP-binding cassette domain-containing protein [Eubacteriales bacterium]|nr:ATP-binding cassette domain-containing protein [Eubacteriales bacterium]
MELKNICKAFGKKSVLDNISLNVEGGKAFGILGRNGAGKTTTIRILMNVFAQDKGEILVDGMPIDYDKISIGYLPEERGLYPKKKIIDQLVYLSVLKGMDKKTAVEAIDYWLDKLGMMEYRNQKLESLSKGNQQKIQLITAIVHNPDIIILDEPFSGLDPVNAMLLKDVIKSKIAEGKIVLFSSHQMNYIEEFCDSIAIIKSGEIILSGDLAKIKKDYVRDKLVVRSENNDAIIEAFSDRCTRINDDTLILKLDIPSDKKVVMKQLVDCFDVDEVRVFEPSLNDIFVEYAGDEKKAEIEGK